MKQLGMSENGVQTPNEIAIFRRDNDQQNHWVFRGTLFSDKPNYNYLVDGLSQCNPIIYSVL